jgi:hypothetical protein
MGNGRIRLVVGQTFPGNNAAAGTDHKLKRFSGDLLGVLAYNKC